MQVELERVGPVGRGARLRMVLGTLVPLVTLAVVVAFALPRPGPELPKTAPEASATGGGGAPGVADPEPAPAGGAAPGLPRFAYGLEVRSVGDVLAARRAGLLRRTLVAVAGSLRNRAELTGCDGRDAGLTALFCERTGRLDAGSAAAAVPAFGPAASAAPGGGYVPHLHPRILRGTPIPALFSVSPPSPGGGTVEAVPVIVIGRFASVQPADCPDEVGPSGPCRDEFVLERLAWAAGSWIDRTLVRDPGLPEAVLPSVGPRLQTIASREADRMERILALAVLQPGWLMEIDPVAALAAATGRVAAAIGVPADGPVWYLRSVSRPVLDREHHLTWAVIDHTTGQILATGAVGQD